MGDEKNAFYVVRKGDIVGVYKSLCDCQAEALVFDGNTSIYKGYSLSRNAEEHLASRGLKNASYSISADDVKNELFGKLVACPFQHPESSRGSSNEYHTRKRLHDVSGLYIGPPEPSRVFSYEIPTVEKSDPSYEIPTVETSREGSGSYHGGIVLPNQFISEIVTNVHLLHSCTLAFDGAAKGNPGPAGAGAVLCSEDGRRVCHLREGVGIATNNVAEYRALILGLRHALKEGFNDIRVQGDSLLVCNQIQGLWKIKNQKMAELCQEAKDLKAQFLSFKITHVLRDLNTAADTQANQAIYLKDGQVIEDCK